MVNHEYVKMEFFYKKDLHYLEKITKPATSYNKRKDFLLTINTFYAEWCPNCHYDVKTLNVDRIKILLSLLLLFTNNSTSV